MPGCYWHAGRVTPHGTQTHTDAHPSCTGDGAELPSEPEWTEGAPPRGLRTTEAQERAVRVFSSQTWKALQTVPTTHSPTLRNVTFPFRQCLGAENHDDVQETQ